MLVAIYVYICVAVNIYIYGNIYVCVYMYICVCIYIFFFMWGIWSENSKWRPSRMKIIWGGRRFKNYKCLRKTLKEKWTLQKYFKLLQLICKYFKRVSQVARIGSQVRKRYLFIHSLFFLFYLAFRVSIVLSIKCI